MSRPTCRRLLIPLLLSPLTAMAMDYGIYDARGQAMGGAGVAAASWHSAQYYNPAILGLHRSREDDSRDGRFVFPNIVAQADNVAGDIVDAVSDDLEQQLTDNVNAFNNDPSAQNAGAVAGSARELESLLQDLGNQSLTGDAFIGFSVSEPSLLEGGAFYFGVRSLGFGDSDIPQDDFDLMSRYIDALEVIAAGGDPATIPADLLDADGNLIDPTDQFNSSADLSAIAISEWAVAVAKEFDVFGQALSIGVTPKVMRVDVFRETTNFDDNDFNFTDSQKSYVNLNADFGVALELFDHYRFGLAVKDAIPETYTTTNDLELTLKARTRFGMAYVNDWVTVGLDYDVSENAPIAAEAPSQDLSVGLEVSPFRWLQLRAGYRQYQTGLRADVISGGLAWRWSRLAMELSYAQSESSTGAGLQLGWVF